jgi:hypothetical protein
MCTHGYGLRAKTRVDVHTYTPVQVWSRLAGMYLQLVRGSFDFAPPFGESN